MEIETPICRHDEVVIRALYQLGLLQPRYVRGEDVTCRFLDLLKRLPQLRSHGE